MVEVNPNREYRHVTEWGTSVQFLKGVGPHLAEVLRTRGIKTVGELLEWYPRAYEDRRVARSIASLKIGEIVSITLTVVRVSSQPLGKSKRRIYDVLLKDSTGFINAKYFRVPYKGYFERFQPGQSVRVVGKVTTYRGKTEFHHPDIRDDDALEVATDCLVPLYTETEGITLQRLRKIIESALEAVDGRIPERIPKDVLDKYKLPTLAESLKCIHNPPNESGPEFAHLKSRYHRRIIFEEFFWMELLLADKRSLFKAATGVQMRADATVIDDVRAKLPFRLTTAQDRVLSDILKDMVSENPMHRLVQGDVGSGKTVVALLAALFAIRAGYQTAFMAPTEILSEQHLNNATKLLTDFGVRVASLTGGQTNKERSAVLEGLVAGEIDLVIGTHALLEDDVKFKNLGLVVVDEQHRFGVEQRQVLKNKGRLPHFLLMTATPIPRTLAMTVYGDLDVSQIDELPPGRTPIVTRVVGASKEVAVYEFIRDQIKKGRQAYIVYPLVEESEKIDLKNAVQEFEKLKTLFPEFQLGLLHGKMKPSEKDEVMGRFRKNEIQILVSTTVIEVGVDVPNSTIMLIEHSERFGLSQLHQLRGRVGRGSHKSYCILKLGRAVSDEARARTQMMAETNDGFKIAEFDLEMRGPGQFLGTRQSGLTGFKMANLVRDADVLAIAREAAFDIISKDPGLKSEKNKSLRIVMTSKDSPVGFATVG